MVCAAIKFSHKRAGRHRKPLDKVRSSASSNLAYDRRGLLLCLLRSTKDRLMLPLTWFSPLPSRTSFSASYPSYLPRHTSFVFSLLNLWKYPIPPLSWSCFLIYSMGKIFSSKRKLGLKAMQSTGFENIFAWFLLCELLASSKMLWSHVCLLGNELKALFTWPNCCWSK